MIRACLAPRKWRSTRSIDNPSTSSPRACRSLSGCRRVDGEEALVADGHQRADFDHIVEMFAGFGPVAVRRMFSGAGIFADGLMIGLVSKGVIYLKADDITRPEFEHEGLGPFTYRTQKGERALLSYWRMPERLYDEPDELARWAQAALACARRKAEAPPRGARKLKKKKR